VQQTKIQTLFGATLKVALPLSAKLSQG